MENICNGNGGGKCYSPNFCNEFGCAANMVDSAIDDKVREIARLKSLISSAIRASDCGEIWGRDKVHEAMMLIGGQES